MMRWKQVGVGLALIIAGALGCRQQCFLNECDYNHYRDLTNLGSRLECDPKISIQPTTVAVPPPSTVLDPERKIRYLSLAEAIAIALEQGRVGDVDPTGTILTSQIVLGIPSQSTDTIHVLAFDPAISAADIEASLAKFDVQWTTAANWTTTDLAPTIPALQQVQNGQAATVLTRLLKPLPTGGVANITFQTMYEKFVTPPAGTTFNPAYTPLLQFQFEQPLLQGYGVEINQLRAVHPGSTLAAFPQTARVPGILLTRLRFDEARAEFERRVHLMLRNVEQGYWNLYNAYWILYSREQGLRQAYESWRVTNAQFLAGRKNAEDVARARQQYESFRAQRISSLGSGTFVPPLGQPTAGGEGLLERERSLRNLLGMPVEDGTRLVPIDTPTLTPYQPDWNTAVNETLALRPELTLARQDLKFQQLNLINTKNLLLPDLRFTSQYGINGAGNTLEGSNNGTGTVVNAFRSLASDRFVNWAVGLSMTYTLGYRDAHAQLRQARLNLARSYGVLQEQETKAQHALAVDYRRLFEFYELMRIQRAQREAAAERLRVVRAQYLAGATIGGQPVLLNTLLDAQQAWAEALRAEYDAVVQYNIAIIAFEFDRGTIMQFDNVVIGEGPLPHCAQVRAVEHERERSKAIVLRERANPVATPCGDGSCGLPQLPADEAPSVPSLFEGQPPVPELPPEPLPQPKPVNPKDTKPETSSKASPPQMSPADGVPGVIILSEPAQEPAPAAADKARREPPPRLPPTLPEGSPSASKRP